MFCGAGPEMPWYVNGVVQYMSKGRAYANGNIIDSGGAKVNFHAAALTCTLLLKSGAQVMGAGTEAGAPTVAILGVRRTAPYTAGAYGYPN